LRQAPEPAMAALGGDEQGQKILECVVRET